MQAKERAQESELRLIGPDEDLPRPPSRGEQLGGDGALRRVGELGCGHKAQPLSQQLDSQAPDPRPAQRLRGQRVPAAQSWRSATSASFSRPRPKRASVGVRATAGLDPAGRVACVCSRRACSSRADASAGAPSSQRCVAAKGIVGRPAPGLRLAIVRGDQGGTALIPGVDPHQCPARC